MTKLERKAALAVAAATAGVIVSGVSLLRKHTRYLTQKAASTFGPDEMNDKEEMDELTKRLAEDNVTLTFTPAFEDYMVEHGYDPAYGARPVKRLLQRDLVNQLAKAILDGTVRKDSSIRVDAANGEVLLGNA